MPPQAGMPGRSRTPLSDYVRAYIERRGISKNQFVKTCVDPQDATRVMYIQWLDALLDARGPAPELWRLRALAAGMRADLEDLKRMAALQWLEYGVEEGRHGSDVIMIAVSPDLSDEQRRRIKRLAEAMAREEASGG